MSDPATVGAGTPAFEIISYVVASIGGLKVLDYGLPAILRRFRLPPASNGNGVPVARELQRIDGHLVEILEELREHRGSLDKIGEHTLELVISDRRGGPAPGG